MNSYLYVCTRCGSGSWTMSVSEHLVYFPNPEEKKQRPYMSNIGHEVLICNCGEMTNWYQMKELTKTGETTLDEQSRTLNDIC